MTLVQALGQLERGLGREAEAAVGLALQAGQVVQETACLGGGFAFFGDAGGLAAHRLHDGQGLTVIPEAVGAQVAIGIVARGFLEGRIEPFARVLAGLGQEGRMNLPVVAAAVGADLLLALNHDGQRGRLHPAHGGQEKAAVARVEGRHRPRAVDAHQPVGLGAAARGVGEASHLLVAAQLRKAVADGLRRHGLQPQALHRLAQALVLAVLLAAGVLLDEAEDQLPFAARVAGVDQATHILALGQLDNGRQARLGLVDGLELEEGRQHRQVGEAPLAALDVELLGRGDLHQVTDGRGHDVLLVLEMVVVLVELARHRGEGAHDVLGHGRLLGNDQGFVHLYNLGFTRVYTRTWVGARTRAPA